MAKSLFIFDEIIFISFEIFSLNNLLIGFNSLLAEVINTYSVVKFGEIKGDKVLIEYVLITSASKELNPISKLFTGRGN